MGLLKKLLNWRESRKARKSKELAKANRPDVETTRRCFIESMEPRLVMDADALFVGAVYFEEDSGSDAHGDTFEVTFLGGAPQTELTHVEISGDRAAPGFSVGDVFFDTADSGLGADHAFPFTIVSLKAKDSRATVKATVNDGSTLLALDFEHFQAGDKLVFSIDVDEVVDFDPAETDLSVINSNIDPITSGVEFQGSSLKAHFQAPEFFDIDALATFRNAYDDKLAGTGLDLRPDNFNNLRDRSTGTATQIVQQPVPASLSGVVYHDRNNNGLRDNGEEGIGGVQLRVSASRSVIPQADVTVTTLPDGSYRVTNLVAGTYRVTEVQQPTGYLDGLDTPGTVKGKPIGSVTNPGDQLSDIALASGDDGIDYNFGELKAASLRGRVQLADKDGDCFSEDGDVHPPLPNVRVVLKDATGRIVGETRTDADGQYSFENLLPGVYTIVESTPVGYIQAGQHVGMVDGVTRGVSVIDDVITNIDLLSGDNGVKYDFCEYPPAKLAGFVYHDKNNDGKFDSNESPIANVELSLLDANGKTLSTTKSAADGSYSFNGLRAGNYSIVEKQPAGWLDGIDSPGVIGGVPKGTAKNPGDRIQNIEVQWGDEGVHFDFGELLPTSIQGRVCLSDGDGDCFDKSVVHEPLPGVRIVLQDADGNFLQETTTDANGQYQFAGLTPGTYRIVEVTPDDLLDGDEHVGSVNGVTNGRVLNSDTLVDIVLSSGEDAIDYDFCELEPATLSGNVYHDANNNGLRDPGEAPIAGVEVTLRDSSGKVVTSVLTKDDGSYEFKRLVADTYSIRESQPVDWLDGQDAVGQISGVTVGEAVNPGDVIRQIVIRYGDHGQEYNFGEILPGSISGVVFSDPNQNCLYDDGESPIGGVTIRLFNENNELIGTTKTDSRGEYRFDGLLPGRYIVREEQPAGYLQGGTIAGSVGRVTGVDEIGEIDLASGQNLVHYDFCEVPPASIEGIVHVDPNHNCEFDPNEQTLEGIRVELVDETGKVVAVTQSDSSGRYRFDNLAPGTYSVREQQPVDYFDGGVHIGTGDGIASLNQIGFVLNGGSHLTDYNFCELPPAVVSGFVFQDGGPIETSNGQPPASLQGIRDGRMTPDDTFIPGVVIELRDGITGAVITADSGLTLPGVYAPGPIRAVTNASGFYEFRGLLGGNSYAVFQVQPAGYYDGIDSIGTTSGFALNRSAIVPNDILVSLTDVRINDAIVRIGVGIGGRSDLNNFSEIKTKLTEYPPPPNPPPSDPPPPFNPPAELPAEAAYAAFALLSPGPNGIPIYGAGDENPYTWHLSVVNGGMPRRAGEQGNAALPANWSEQFVSHIWEPNNLSEGQWVFSDNTELEISVAPEYRLGIDGGIPVTGDFDGDGDDEIGIYFRGRWYIDVNGNGYWDDEDLLAELGSETDLPVTGDWDGDGKDDIGVFGPMWRGDQRAIPVEPGLPDPHNLRMLRPKNKPPTNDEATDGVRVLKRSHQGVPRADKIDHVFEFGQNSDIAVAGDWNGDGVSNIGVYRDGKWKLDEDGDGRLTDRDVQFEFGQPGDRPVVGDFDGDGKDEIGVYRNGTWIFDSNHNRKMDSKDRVFHLGGAKRDIPVVGDWNGDGTDEPGIYRARNDAPTEVPSEVHQVRKAS